MKRIALLLLIFLLTGCSVSPSPSSREIEYANKIERETTTSAYTTPSVISSSTLFHRSTPTSTQTQAYEPTEILSPTVTETPIWMSSLDGYSYTEGMNYSPDKHWFWGISDIAEPDSDSTTSLHTTRIVSTDGKTVWDVRPTNKQLGGREFSDASYIPIFWLPKEPYVYLSLTTCCTDGYGPGYFTGMNLARLDLSTGEFSLQIAQWGFHEFIFSSNGKYLFEVTAWNPEIHITRLSTWKQKTIEMPPHNRRNGGGAWSPNNQQIAFFSIVDDPQDEDNIGHTSIILADAGEKPEFRVLVDNVEETLGSDLGVGCIHLEWIDLNNIGLNMDPSCGSTDQWSIDVDSGRVIKIK